jgi:hypothetical protein
VREVRSPLDYMRQGGVFDRYGNKSVESFQVSGDFLPKTIRIDGVEPATPTFGVCSAIPPLLSVGGNTWLDVTFMPFLEYYASDSWRFTTSVEVSGHRRIQSVTGYHRASKGVIGKYTGISCPSFTGLSSEKNLYDAEINELKARYKAAVEGLPLDQEALLSVVMPFAIEACDIWERYRSHLSTADTWSSGTVSGDFQSDNVSVDVEAIGLLEPFRAILEQSTLGPEELSSHARQIIDGVNDFDSNAIAMAGDLRKTGDTVRSILSLPRNLKNPKAWASAWLSGRYGDRLTIADTEELLTSMRRALLSRQFGTFVRRQVSALLPMDNLPSIDVRRTSTLIVANKSYNDLMTSVENLMRWDAWPTLENTWDMIPLSFVVDWVIPVSDLLGQIDACVEAPYLKPLTSYVGERRVWRINLPPNIASGPVEFVYYKRAPHDILGDVKPFTWNVTPPSFSVVHAADALALLVQTSRRA